MIMIRWGNAIIIKERRESEIANTTFDCGGTPTFTTVSNYAKLRIVKRIDEDASTVELIKKLDSLKDEPTVEYSNAFGARHHIRKLIQE